MDDSNDRVPQGEAQEAQESSLVEDSEVCPDGESSTVEDRPSADEVIESGNERTGTTSSARFNILSTMVGGGSLSLPKAFQESGNGLLGPLLLILVAAITEFCFRILVASARTLSPVSHDQTIRGKDSFESVAYAAFGSKAYVLSTALVTAMCFFGTLGYAVLLRDMLQPISDLVFSTNGSGPTFANNATMLTVVLLVTPLCTLKTLTALERFGAASMVSVLILGSCIVYRSLQCNLGLHSDDDKHHNWRESFQLWPDSWKDVLDAFPLYVSCFVCHYNILVVHNELRNPSLERVGWWLRSTTWVTTAFYMIMGLAGSAYGACTPSGKVQGNVLLDFNDDDPLLLVGRMCLALTITLAFPMLTIPARDILIRSLPSRWVNSTITTPSLETASNGTLAVDNVCVTATTTPSHETASNGTNGVNHDAVEDETPQEALREPLLNDEERQDPTPESTSTPITTTTEQTQAIPTPSFWIRLLAAISIFWSATLVASCVSSIDIVWDLLGSSLSILLSHLIPCGSYLVIARQRQEQDGWKEHLSQVVAWILLIVFVPLMFVSTGNAVYDTFFKP